MAKRAGGADELVNLESLCKPCHSRATRHEVAAHPGGGVTIVAGPPGSGKSRFVEEQAQWGELVVDLDRIFEALSGQPRYEKPDGLRPFVFDARDAVLAHLARRDVPLSKAWVISSSPRRADRHRLHERLQATRVVVCAVDAAECLRRIAGDPRRRHRLPLWDPIVRQWWRDYEPRDGEEVVRG